MATELTITAASVVAGTGANKANGIAGETITQGMLLYLKAADGKLWKADGNSTAATAAIVGVALSAASAGQPIFYQTGGLITIGSAVVVGTVYIAGATAGTIATVADALQGFYTSILGIAVSVTQINISINVGGVVVA